MPPPFFWQKNLHTLLSSLWVVAGCQKELAPVGGPPSTDATELSKWTVVTRLKLGREIAVDLKPDANFNQDWRCPCHDGSVLRLALPRTATLPTANIAKEMRYKRLFLLAQ